MKPFFFLPILLLFFTKANAGNPYAPFNLRTCDKLSPTGTSAQPFFGWYTSDPDANDIQTAYQILVSSNPDLLKTGKGDIWDSGKKQSPLQNYIDFGGKKLAPGQRYYWKIRTWDRAGTVSPYSAISYFDTGLFTAKDWQGANWIRRTSKDPNIYTYFRKQLKLTGKPIKKAIAYVSAYHNYEFYLNGGLIGKGLAYHYPQYAFYKAYDVTSALKDYNTLAVMTHWYGGGQGRPKGDSRFLLKLQVSYIDGTEETFGTDKTWKQTAVEAFNPKTKSRNGEGIGFIDVIDSRKAIANWEQPSFDDVTWENAVEIGPHPSAPFIGELKPDLTTLREKKIKPVSVKSLGKGRYLVDLGKIYAGVPIITFNGGKAGDTVRLRGGFVRNADGTVSEKINQSTDLSYQFVLNGKSCQFQPIVYLGYQYLQVDGSPNELTTENVSFNVRFYELDLQRAVFSSSDSMLNKVYELMAHSLTLGAQEGFVDTPTREKGVFLGDSFSQGVAAMQIMGDRALNHRVLLQFLDSQDQYWPDGRLNAVYPNVDGKRDIPDFTQQYLLWVWDYYQLTGNVEFLKTNYSKLKNVANYVANYTNPTTGLIHKLAGGSGPYQYGIIDWPANMRYGYDMATEARTVINAYAYADFNIVAKVAAIVGQPKDAEIFRAKATAVRNAMNKLLINADGVYIDGLLPDGKQSTHVSQHANMFPLALDIVPNVNYQAVLAAVKTRQMSVGMVTVRFLPMALGMADEAQQLLTLYTNTNWDGWAKNISMGATATWESWNALERNDSMCHPWGTSGLDGIQRFVLGVSVIKPQHELIQVKPLDFEGKLTKASGIVPSDKGDIIVAWQRTPKSYRLKLESPNNVTANVYVPKSGATSNTIRLNGKPFNAKSAGKYFVIDNVGAGKHVFEVEF